MTDVSRLPRCTIESWRLRFGPLFYVSFQRTVRLSVGASTVEPLRSFGAAPLVGLGKWPAVAGALAADFVLPVDDAEAIWLGLEPAHRRAVCALRVSIDEPDGLDAVTGATWSDALSDTPQNYVVCPPQFALDGVRVARSAVRQFVRSGPSTEGDPGACTIMRLVAIPPSRPDPPPEVEYHKHPGGPLATLEPANGMAGPAILQPLARDPFGLAYWDPGHAVSVRGRFLASGEYERLTGQQRPAPLDERSTFPGRRLP